MSECAIGEEAALVLPSISVIKSSAAAAAERKARSRVIDNQEYDDVTYECNLSLVLL